MWAQARKDEVWHERRLEPGQKTVTAAVVGGNLSLQSFANCTGGLSTLSTPIGGGPLLNIGDVQGYNARTECPQALAQDEGSERQQQGKMREAFPQNEEDPKHSRWSTPAAREQGRQTVYPVPVGTEQRAIETQEPGSGKQATKKTNKTD